MNGCCTTRDGALTAPHNQSNGLRSRPRVYLLIVLPKAFFFVSAAAKHVDEMTAFRGHALLHRIAGVRPWRAEMHFYTKLRPLGLSK